ncbi:ribokinase [Pseudonocardia spinosispora]|uniref:ribokinase n=1 Tax=Pseudonocardia spinosispora TaxID=103441 RepID=UPI00040B53EB|nr:ribokinase [Pseudonocardia spinosispora]
MTDRPAITVVGSTMIDLISYLERMPDQGETVFGRSFAQGFGGKGANQAVMAALLGADVAMVNRVGDDSFGRETIANFRSFGVDVSQVGVEPTYSGVANIMVEPSGDNRIILGPGANERLSASHVERAFAALRRPGVVLSQLEVPQSAILRGFQLAKHHGATTILNPAPAAPVAPEILELCDWLIPNETECELLVRATTGSCPSDLAERTRALGESCGVAVVTTLGANGAMLYRPGIDDTVRHLHAPPVEVRDSTGAGDAFVGAFGYAIGRGIDPLDAIEFALELASDSVTRPGTQISFPTGTHLDNLLARTIVGRPTT